MLVARRAARVAGLLAFATGYGALGMVACDSSTGPELPTRFAPFGADSLFIGKTLGVVTLSTRDGSVVTAAPQEWSSSDTSVAVVVGGRVFALGAGTARITAQLDGHQNTIRARVVPLWLDAGVQFTRTSTGYWVNCAINSAGGTSGHTCGIRSADSALFCFGRNDVGQFGRDPAHALESIPQPVAGGFRAPNVAAGRRHTCAIDLDGAAHCCGLNVLGVLGLPRNEVNFTGTPQRVRGGLTFTRLTADGHTCGITPSKALYCWGLYPQSTEMVARLGDARYSPVHVARGLRFRSVSTSAHSVCGVTVDNRLTCF